MNGVSVILCCYNSASKLRQTLSYLAKQQFDQDLPREIILVDNASTDNTKEIAAKVWSELARTDMPLRVVDQPVPGLTNARAMGIETSVYNSIVFCDDDNWLQSNYLNDAHALLLEHPEIGAVGGTGVVVSDAELPDWFDDYKGCFACYPQSDKEGELKGVLSFLYGAGLVVRREVVERLKHKNFNPILPDRIGINLTSGGDTELSYAIRLMGYKLWFSEKLKFYHYLPSSRLNERYLHRLMSSMSYCSGLLMVYNYVLTGKRVTRLTWIKDVVYQILFFGGSLIKFLIENKPARERKLNVIFSFNRMRSILFQGGTYIKRYNEISRLTNSTTLPHA